MMGGMSMDRRYLEALTHPPQRTKVISNGFPQSEQLNDLACWEASQ
jgi:hypothetical protein